MERGKWEKIVAVGIETVKMKEMRKILKIAPTINVCIIMCQMMYTADR